MALETMVFPQDFFAYSTSDESLLFPFGKGSFVNYEFDAFPGENYCLDVPFYSSQMLPDVVEDLDARSSPCPQSMKKGSPSEPVVVGRRKRQRMRNVKNREDIENQRMTHIAVERNRRRQMNEYLATLRSLMPQSYAQRGDQASIVGGAINYVKELEQQLQSLQVQKKVANKNSDTIETVSPFADFFTFPQYSSSPNGTSTCSDSTGSTNSCYSGVTGSYSPGIQNGIIVDSQLGLADVEVTMVESHANLKVSTRRRPKQLVKIVAGLQNMQLIPQHLNMTSANGRVMYSFSLKVEDESKLTSVDEIAAAVYQMLGRIQEEASFISS